jgi:prepilin-type N-terminal cleavage/methylation domain-containing protein
MVIRTRQSGFNLVELMVVVGIIGILSAVAVPRFSQFKARSQQTEAKSTLNGLFMAMSAYEANYGAYLGQPTADDATPGNVSTYANGIGFFVSGQKQLYQLSLITDGTAGTPDATYWAATASTKAKLVNSKFDIQRINTNKWLCTVFDAVTQTAATEETSAKSADNNAKCGQKADGSAVVAAALVAGDLP